MREKKENKKEKLVATAIRAIVAVGILHEDALAAAFAAPLYLKFLHLLEHVLLQFNHPLFLELLTRKTNELFKHIAVCRL